MIVAQLRGAKFNGAKPVSGGDWYIAYNALDDIVTWLGFQKNKNSTDALDEYLRRLPIEREKIFLRAKDKK